MDIDDSSDDNILIVITLIIILCIITIFGLFIIIFGSYVYSTTDHSVAYTDNYLDAQSNITPVDSLNYAECKILNKNDKLNKQEFDTCLNKIDNNKNLKYYEKKDYDKI